MDFTTGQAASWYHGRILRIPHGKQNPTKRYYTDEQVVEVFTGEVEIQEKIDGKLGCELLPPDSPHFQEFRVYETPNPKDSVHDHVIKYKINTGRILLDRVVIGFDELPEFQPLIRGSPLKYGTVRLTNPTIEEIRLLLEAYSKLKSHFGSPIIEGLVCKNYERQLMAKWVNDAFEDGVHGRT